MSRQLEITLEDIAYQVEIEGEKVLVNGRPFAVTVDGDAARVDGIAHTVVIEGQQAIFDGIAYPFQTRWAGVEKKAARAETAPEAGEGAVTAIMPGKIMRVLVEVGDQVTEGDVVCVLEAMKMENELHAQKAGEVEAVHVSSGDDVEMGAVLVEIA
ncbi:MAG: biotin/lipoyl-containing protein [Chloroflexota bacterium]|nr:biotin/lipoyl-containing protein [Chloroflexota bacterium]